MKIYFQYISSLLSVNFMPIKRTFSDVSFYITEFGLKEV